MMLKDLVSTCKLQLKAKFWRLKIGHINFYLSRRPLQPIQFEKQQRKKKRHRLRRQVLDRAGHRCEICGCEIDWRSVSVHHIKPRLTHPELEFDADNLMALCRHCHEQLHERERLTKLHILPTVCEN